MRSMELILGRQRIIPNTTFTFQVFSRTRLCFDIISDPEKTETLAGYDINKFSKKSATYALADNKLRVSTVSEWDYLTDDESEEFTDDVSYESMIKLSKIFSEFKGRFQTTDNRIKCFSEDKQKIE